MDLVIVLTGILPALAVAVGVCAYDMRRVGREMNAFTKEICGED